MSTSRVEKQLEEAALHKLEPDKLAEEKDEASANRIPWTDPPGYRETIAALGRRIPWKVLTPPRGGMAIILIKIEDRSNAPYQYLNSSTHEPPGKQ